MSKKYVIIKSSRMYSYGPGYTGPACEKAGVVPGKIYCNENEAWNDSYKLSSVNPVGFYVEEYKESE